MIVKNGWNFLFEFYKVIGELMEFWEKDIVSGKKVDVFGEVK